MGVRNFQTINPDYKNEVISAAEALMINCHHLASDIIDLARKDTGIEPRCARALSRQLSECAGQLAAAMRKLDQQMRPDGLSVPGGS